MGRGDRGRRREEQEQVEEIELLAELIVRANQQPHMLTLAEIDEILDVLPADETAERQAVA